MTANVPATPAEYDQTRLTKRPDGFYWQSLDGDREYGAFPTLSEAAADMQSADAALESGDTPEAGDALEAGETLQEAEDEIGIADWLDPDTGEPCEEYRPHLPEE